MQGESEMKREIETDSGVGSCGSRKKLEGVGRKKILDFTFQLEYLGLAERAVEMLLLILQVVHLPIKTRSSGGGGAHACQGQRCRHKTG